MAEKQDPEKENLKVEREMTAERGEEAFRKLRLYNLVMGFFHLAQALLIYFLSSDFSLPVTTSYLKYDPLARASVPFTREVAQLRIGPLVAIFLLLSAMAHFLVSSPGIFEWYVRNLERHINIARWIEYSFSASLMIMVIAMLSGMYDLGSLILIFFLNAMMILFGWMMELHNQTTEKTDWTAFVFGCIAGMVPWVVIFMYFIGAAMDSANAVPKFVYGIMVSIFIFFNIFAVNMVLQYKKVGPWRDYLFGERMYILLSLLAKSALAWQVFGGTLRPQ